MLASRIVLRPLAARTTLLSALLAVMPCSSGTTALAGEPATVTVRVEGFDGARSSPQTQVTTTATPVARRRRHAAAARAPVGALVLTRPKATGRPCKRASSVEILGIDGVDLPPFGSENYAYWVDLAEQRIVRQHRRLRRRARTGADVVCVAQCFATGPFCPSDASAPEHFLTATRPNAATIDVGESVIADDRLTPTGSGEAVAAGRRQSQRRSVGRASPRAGRDDDRHLLVGGSLHAAGASAPDSVPSDAVDGLRAQRRRRAVRHERAVSAPARASAGFHGAAPYKGPYALVAARLRTAATATSTAPRAPRGC